MFNTTITLFNYHEQSDMWYMSVIEKADCIIDESVSPTTRGLSDGNTADIKIQTYADKSIVVKDDSRKAYVGPKAFASDNSPIGKFTFTPERDFIVVGDLSSLTLGKESTYETGLYDALNAQFDDVYIVQKAAFFGLIPHFEVGGR